MDRKAYSVLEVKSIDEERRTFDGIASTISPDRVGDIVEPKGAQYASSVPLLNQHKADQPIGSISVTKVTADAIYVRGQVEQDDPALPEIARTWAQIKKKLVRGLSIGFRSIEEAWNKETNGFRFIKWELLEVSAVTIPANQQATITSIKSIVAATRAALGAHASAGDRPAGSTSPGASGHTSKGRNVKTLKQMQEERSGIVARMKELNDGAGGDIATLEDDEQKEFDTLGDDLESLDVAIKRQDRIERAVNGATSVTKGAEEGDDGFKRGANTRQSREPKDAPKLEPGIAFAQYVKFLGLARRNGGGRLEAAAYAEAAQKQMPMYIDPRVPMALKAAVEAGSVGGTDTAGNWGMSLVSATGGVSADFAEWLRPQTILGRFGQGGIPALNRVPFRRPLGSITSAGTGYWVGEGKAKPLTKFGFDVTSLSPMKVAALAAATMELLEDSDPSADLQIRNLLRDALVETKDVAFIDPANGGSANVKPASITNGVSGTPSSGTDAASVRTDVKAAMAGYIAANNPASSAVWIMSATDALSLSLMFNALGTREFDGIDINGGRFAGLPVIVSEYVPTDTGGHLIALVNARDIYYAETGAIQVRTSDQAALEMDDAPGQDSVTPTASTSNMVSMFQTNSVAFLAEQRLNWAKRRAEAVQVITGASWGTGGTAG